jgi:hypothetical protein
LAIQSFAPRSSGPPITKTTEVPFQNGDLETRLARAIESIPPPASVDPKPTFTKKSQELARALASKMKDYPVEYNKPSRLLLGDSTAVQFMIKTDARQEFDPYFKEFEGEVVKAEVLVASRVSAQLTGPPDRLQITLRGDNRKQTISPH